MLLAARGARATAGGTEPIRDRELVELLRRKAGRIQLQSILAAFAVTILLLLASLFFPWRPPPV